jgi:hypothetical protein
MFFNCSWNRFLFFFEGVIYISVSEISTVNLRKRFLVIKKKKINDEFNDFYQDSNS